MYRHDDCMCKPHDYSMSESKKMYMYKEKDDYMYKEKDDYMHKSKDMYMCKEKDDCMHKSKEYARAYILPQKYENLFSCKEGFLMGTIFKDLYRPYHDHKHDHDCKKNKC
ncbi:spore coat associated protein CotJA [Clostridium puniceum]|uniref:Spore coat associated protein CotJA n=2 Tax=Clostridium puniceum TaxID=29367 RepID=A0A1S8TXJ3_9CLOT|nr:spore coat associated protein CotJA [Clostridium puniceum]OOM82135.1 spore coat associated protein CotJA [Clostridium puniceum]